MRKHYVTFSSPGTFFNEQSTKPIASWDVAEAVRMSRKIVERYNAKPYGFYFTTNRSADPVPDGEGGFLDVEEKRVAKSGTYFLGGELLTVDAIAERKDPKEEILLSNMRANDWPIVLENRNSFRCTMPFEEEDFLLDASGAIQKRGDDPELVEYRTQKIAEHRAEMESERAV